MRTQHRRWCSANSYSSALNGISFKSLLKYAPMSSFIEMLDWLQPEAARGFCQCEFLCYLSLRPAACLGGRSVFLTVKDVENVLKFAERNLKGNIFVLACSAVVKKNHFDDIHLLQIKIGWNQWLWSEFMQCDKQGNQNTCTGTDRVTKRNCFVDQY